MTVAPIRERPTVDRPTVVRPTVVRPTADRSTADRPAGVLPGRLPSGLRQALAEATPGEYALLEAGLAWYQRRPAGTGRGWAQGQPASYPGSGRYLLLAQRCEPDVADRLVRLLERLTWAVTVPAVDPDGVPDPAGRASVLVPDRSYHLVVRALSTAWRHARRGHGAGTTGGRPDQAGAAALWRMGLLLGRVSGAGDTARLYLPLRTTPESVAGLLAGAAWALGVAAAIENTPGRTAVVLRRPEDIRRLAAAANLGVPDGALR